MEKDEVKECLKAYVNTLCYDSSIYNDEHCAFMYMMFLHCEHCQKYFNSKELQCSGSLWEKYVK